MGLGPRQLGHLVIRVRDLEKAEDFYTRIVGLKIMQKYEGNALFMAANGELSHELAIFRADEDAPGPDQNRVGLVHMAWQMDSFEDLKAMHHRLKDNDIEVDHYGDHGLSLGIYFLDPEGNEIETYYELPKSEWITDGEHLFDQRKVHFGDSKFPEILEDADKQTQVAGYRLGEKIGRSIR
jgi:catechol-2,3-dioxygenase